MTRVCRSGKITSRPEHVDERGVRMKACLDGRIARVRLALTFCFGRSPAGHSLSSDDHVPLPPETLTPPPLDDSLFRILLLPRPDRAVDQSMKRRRRRVEQSCLRTSRRDKAQERAGSVHRNGPDDGFGNRGESRTGEAEGA